jgi:hypothetical protein
MKTLVVPGSRPLGAPKGWDQELDGACGVLFVVDAVDVQSGQNFQYSFYKPTVEDLEALLQGGVLRLGIMGTTHPVLNLGIFSPELTSQLNAKEGFDMGPVLSR